MLGRESEGAREGWTGRSSPYYTHIGLVTIWTIVIQALIIRTPPYLEVSCQDSICAMPRRWVAQRMVYLRSSAQYSVHPESPHGEAELRLDAGHLGSGMSWPDDARRGSSATAAVGGGAAIIGCLDVQLE
jgi:hypothetical protein